MYDILQLNEMLVPELKALAKGLGLKGYNRLAKQDLIYKILDEQAIKGGGFKLETDGSEPDKQKQKKKDSRTKKTKDIKVNNNNKEQNPEEGTVKKKRRRRTAKPQKVESVRAERIDKPTDFG